MNNKRIIVTSIVTLASQPVLMHRSGPSTWDQTETILHLRKAFCEPGRRAGPEVLWTATVGPGYGGPVIKEVKSIYSTEMIRQVI